MFEGVFSCAFLYINGQYVGFTQGSHLQAEFDITEYVQEGSNTVRVKVVKWCCGSYLEDQDFLDGLVFADRSLKAGSLEAKAAYQPIRTEYQDGVLSVYNRLDFTNLNEYQFEYYIEVDGKRVDGQQTVLFAEPHTSVKLKVEYMPAGVPLWGISAHCLKEGR